MDNLNSLLIVLFALGSLISAENIKNYTFPEGFMFGAATASYQIEGAWNVDGKIPSIWDTATHRVPNGVKDNSTGDEAALSYYFYEKDVEALRKINAKMYRFSIAWTRVMDKNMQENPKGIAYYNKLIDALIRDGIEPMVTIYHWDLPQWLQDLGGWTNVDIVKYYELYADLVFRNFGDRVKIFITFNEPAVFCDEGYSWGSMAPHIWSYNNFGGFLCSHNILLSHAAAYRIYKEKYFEVQQGKVGICFNTGYSYPAHENVTQETADRNTIFYFGRYANPIFSEEGDYPAIMREAVDKKSEQQGRPFSRMPRFTTDQIESLRGSADFLALNYYTSGYAAPISESSEDINPIEHDSEVFTFHDPEWKKSRSPWLVQVPQGLYDILHWIRTHYNNPEVYISENGWSDAPLEVQDDGRVEYLELHLAALSLAIQQGCNVKGYTVWSLVDNFEWMKGYDERFGIYAIDLNDPERPRIPKKSSLIYGNVVKNMYVEADEDKIFIVKTFGNKK